MPDAPAAICAYCRHLHDYAKRDGWYRWMCMLAPIEPTVNPVSGENTEPWRLCRNLNDGSCEQFEKGHNVLNPAPAMETA